MTNLIMPRTHPFKQDEPESMRREVDEPFKKGSRKRLTVTNDGRTIDRVRYRGLVRGRFPIVLARIFGCEHVCFEQIIQPQID